ncbi:DUF362 domain-containing protein [bacterium]|nr:DUF362 domain-containing protein [bacterium]
MNFVVAIVRCDSYKTSVVETVFARGIALLGKSVSELFKPGEKILLKPNMLMASPPEQVACIHPEVFSAVAKWLLEKKADLTFNNSPAIAGPRHAAKKNGLAEAASRLNIPMADFRKGRDIISPEGCRTRKFHIADGVLAADGIVSISKLKTHGFTGMTGAIKNQLGCIPGLRKAEFHARFPDPSEFSRMLVELTLTVAPRLYVMDGIIAMEGKGPNAGNPRPMNFMLLSVDPVALDAVAADIIGMPREQLYVLAHGQKLELGSFRNITVVGDSPDSFKVEDFNIPDISHMAVTSLPVRVFRDWIVPKPVIFSDLCIGCGQCTEICPVNPKAIKIPESKKVPEYTYRHCIRCFCCQEVCPEKAIDIKTPLLGKVLRRLSFR